MFIIKKKMRKSAAALALFMTLFCVGCDLENPDSAIISESVQSAENTVSSAPSGLSASIVEESSKTTMSSEIYTRDTRISDVINDPVFGDYGRLIFPVDEGYYSGETLGDLRLTWYNNIDPDKTVEIANYMCSHAEAGDVIFYDIYSESEKLPILGKKTRDCFSSRELPARNSRYAARAADSRMLELCRTAFLTLWSCQSAATTRSR